jgi:cysteine desulfurase family protein
MDQIIYLDNAASSWPKPPQVAKEVYNAIEKYAANPGRGAHRLALEAGRIVYGCRAALAELFHISNPSDIVFTKNATEALNLPLLCYLSEGDHVITSSVEHNSVIRPLEYMQAKGITYSTINADAAGKTDVDEIEKEIIKHPNTKLLVVSHASNVIGTILPLENACKLAKKYNIKIMVDAAQTAGIIDIPVEPWGIDFLAFPGHKSLMGPQGTGGLYISPEINLPPLFHGGTGGDSESKVMPNIRPDRYEAGTLNTPGLAGLHAGIKFILDTGMSSIREHEAGLTRMIMERLQNINKVHIYGPPINEQRAAVVAFNIQGIESNEVAYMLDKVYNVAVRAGMHCSPIGHRTIGTLEQGVVRVSPGYFNTKEEIDIFVDAVNDIVEEL